MTALAQVYPVLQRERPTVHPAALRTFLCRVVCFDFNIHAAAAWTEKMYAPKTHLLPGHLEILDRPLDFQQRLATVEADNIPALVLLAEQPELEFWPQVFAIPSCRSCRANSPDHRKDAVDLPVT